MDPFTTPERRALAELSRNFASDNLAAALPEWEDSGEIPLTVIRALADTGLLGAGYPEDLGGSGGDIIDVSVITENLISGGASGGFIAGAFSHGIAVPHIVDAIRARESSGDADSAAWLADWAVRPVLAGQTLAALAVTEPDGGSDVAHLRTRAVRDGDDWVINGSKTFITSGTRAGVVVVAARTGEPGAGGVSLFAVDTNNAGFVVTRKLAKMGWHCSDTAELAFVDCRVPDAALLTPLPGGGFASLSRHFAVERLSLATIAHSTAARALDLTVEWVKNRETFGRPLISRQTVRHTLVEMHRQTDVARSYTKSVACAKASGSPVLLEAVMAKNTAVSACEFVVDQAVQLHGGAGYMRSSEVERHYRDARVLGIGGGATEVMTDLAAKLLGW
ncbi:MAG: acyl-CoA dehydrogenase family protein [Actinomycetes bacterium]